MKRKSWRLAGWALGLSLAMAGLGAAVGASQSPVGVEAANVSVLSFNRSGTTDSYTKGYTFAKAASGQTDYYQDGSGTVRYLSLYSTSSTMWTGTPTSATLTATIGGGSAKALTNNVYACYVNSSGANIAGTETLVTSTVTTATGDTYNISMPTSPSSAPYGVKIYHTKESGYNVRYYSFSFAYVQTIHPSSVSLNKNELTLDIGENETLTATVSPSNADNKNLSWESSDDKVATVDQNGKVTAVAAGNATITVSTVDQGKTATCSVTVHSPDEPVIELEYVDDRDSLTVYTGDSFIISATIKNLTSVTYYVGAGEEGLITAEQDDLDYSGSFDVAGSVTITAKGNDDFTTASLTFTILASEISSKEISRTSASLYIHDSIDLTATFTPVGNATSGYAWSSSNSSVATVTSEGHVVANASGSASIIATSSWDNSKTVSCAVTVGKDVTIVAETDEIDNAFTGVSGTTYTDWNGKKDNSDAVYAGKTAGEDSTVQLRTKNSNEGIVTTSSGGNAVRVIVAWNGKTTAGRSIDVFGKDTAYSTPADLYDEEKQGTQLGSIRLGDTKLAIDGSYSYLGIRSHDGALYLDSITIEWGESASGETVTALDGLVEKLHLDHTTTDMSCREEGWYLTAKTTYNSLSADAKRFFLDSESYYNATWKYSDVKARYEAWAEANRDADPYDGKNAISGAGAVHFQSNSDNSMMIVACVAAFGLISVAGIIILPKRKKEK